MQSTNGDNALSRLPRLTPDQLSPEQKSLYEAIAGGPRAQGTQHFPLTDENGGLHGPFNALLLSPRLGAALQRLGSAIRYESCLTARVRELAILRVAARSNSEYEWFAHERVGRAVGLSDAELAIVRDGFAESLSEPHERTAISTIDLALDGDLDDAEYALAVKTLGEIQLFELLTLVGYYQTLALQLRVFRVLP